MAPYRGHLLVSGSMSVSDYLCLHTHHAGVLGLIARPIRPVAVLQFLAIVLLYLARLRIPRLECVDFASGLDTMIERANQFNHEV